MQPPLEVLNGLLPPRHLGPILARKSLLLVVGLGPLDPLVPERAKLLTRTGETLEDLARGGLCALGAEDQLVDVLEAGLLTGLQNKAKTDE